MQCPSCGYIRKPTDNNPDWQCPLCSIVYNKVQCSLLWTKEFISVAEIPHNISNAYIITSNNKLYAFNKSRKSTINQIPLSPEEFTLLIKILEVDLQINSEILLELISQMDFEKINAIYTITNHKIFDSIASFSYENTIEDTDSSTNKNDSENNKDSFFEPVNKENERLISKKSFIERILSLEKKELLCKQCGSEMLQTNHSSGNFTGILKAFIIFFLGLFVLIAFFWTLIGIIIGVLLMLMSLGMGGKREKIWKCPNCGYYFKRI